MIPDATREAILEAMERFDRGLRDSPEWRGWEQKDSHKYAITYNGRRYPVKKTVSIATDTPVSSFSGGDEANTFVEKRGFTVSPLRESVHAEHSIKEILEEILTNYRDARAGGTFGGSHPLWQSFLKLKSAIENVPALRDHPQLRVEWSVGKGNWARVPWLAIIHAQEAEAPRRGIYCVFLFREDMSGVYMALNQGVTKPKEELGTMQARKYLRERANRIRTVVPNLLTRQFHLDENIDLRTEGLGADYEVSTIAYMLYESGRVPDDAVISADLDALVDAYCRALMQKADAPRNEPAEMQKSTWIFQSDPTLFDVSEALKTLTEFTWPVRQHQERIHVGDTVYLWEARPEAGIVAIATVVTEPRRERDDERSLAFIKSSEKFSGDQVRVWLKVDRVLSNQLGRSTLLQHPQLRSLQIISAPQGTNFLVTAEQAEALKALIDVRILTSLEFDRTSAVQELIQAIESAGFVFEPWQVAAYVTALRTKPFVILAGVTGTGKSKLPAVVSRLTGGESDLIPVRPDWTDSADLLGYVDLQGVFRPGRLLQIARQAKRSPDRHWTCIIDEMNLARVEQYFAEVLSRIEDRYPTTTGGFATSPLLAMQLRPEDRNWGELGFGPNIALVGTVNMDETTHGFSRKVLDRAFTLELSDVDLTRWNAATNTPTISSWPDFAWWPRAISLGGLSSPTEREVEAVRKVISVLTMVNGLLQQAQLQIGYRTRDEITLFVLHADEIASAFVTRDGLPVNPLDVAIHMKILPRLIGGSGAVRRAVLQLLGWARSGRPYISDEEAQSVMDEWMDDGRPGSLAESKFPRTTARLCIMWERLQAEGYTSYWL